jgi:dUTP pyrophosphatase
MDIKIKKLHPDAIIPTYGSEGAAGFDFYALENIIVPAHESVLVKTGLSMAIPNGYEIQVRPRSGISLKTPLRVANAPGTIDSDYRGEVCIIIHNTSDSGYEITKHTRIAQGVLKEVPQANFIEVNELDDTTRGDSGFGSTGE